MWKEKKELFRFYFWVEIDRKTEKVTKKNSLFFLLKKLEKKKLKVATDIPSAKDFLHHVARVAHMKVLTPPAALAGDCRFLAANLYARSRFGEDALLNLAVEEGADGRLAGAVRIRSKTQGMALSVGDVLILKQKGSAATAGSGGGSGNENAAPAAEVEVK